MADTAADFKARHKISPAGAFAAALAKEKEAELLPATRLRLTRLHRDCKNSASTHDQRRLLPFGAGLTMRP